MSLIPFAPFLRSLEINTDRRAGKIWPLEQPFRLTAPLFADENKDAGGQCDDVEEKDSRSKV
jgi:hypothetical protein